MPRPARNADCHPDRRHMAHGLCGPCYQRQHSKEKRAQGIYYDYRRYHDDPERKAACLRRAKESVARRKAKDPEGWRLTVRCRNLRHDGVDITPEQYLDMMNTQGGRCAICGVSFGDQGTRAMVDHDHKTGKMRGILCYGCNVALGLFHENVDALEGAIEYLKKNGQAD